MNRLIVLEGTGNHGPCINIEPHVLGGYSCKILVNGGHCELILTKKKLIELKKELAKFIKEIK